MAVRVVGLALAFTTHLILSRVLGASQYGAYAIALGWAMVLAIPARLGLDNSVLRFATIYREEGRGSDFRGLIIFSLASISALSLIIAGALLAAKQIGFGPLRKIEMSLLIGMAMLIPFSAMLGWTSSLVRTANRIFAAQFYEQALRPALLIGALLLFVGTGGRLDAAGAMLLTGATAGIAMICLGLHARTSFAEIPLGPASLEHRGEWLSVSWVLFLMAGVQELLNQIDVILLGILADATEAAHFAAAWRLSSIVPFGLVAVVTVSGPLIASAYHRGDMGELARIARLSARFATLVSLVIALALAALGRPALGLFGPGFSNATPALLILLAGGLVNSATGSVGYLLIMTGHQRAALAIFTAALLLSVLANIMLIPRFGAIGSAMASSLALASWNVTMAIYARRRIGIDASIFGLVPRIPSQGVG
jgi:O-antigen/teichoic acid export membrane protein